ncbi:MAG TPA: polyprenyl synthetase family protein [Oligoflexia bacterium]|nr:polyprenyl synthetase family protein [Oligoflexia bacterium]
MSNDPGHTLTEPKCARLEKSQLSMREGQSREAALGGLKDAAKAAFLSVAPGLQLVEQRIKQRIAADESPFAAIASYLLNLGGKRIRPAIVLLSARLFGQDEPSAEVVDAAAGIELVHMATLLHDDIIDESPLRRNNPSVYAKFGLTPTLLAGDFLWARAYGLCAHLDSFIVSETEQACVALSCGELIEGKLSLERPVSVEQYLDIAEKKTAVLFALAALAGAHLAGAHREDVEAMRRFGLQSGIAFQIADDILDITADEDLLGKPPGTDLRQKTPSLINVLWLLSGDARAKEFFAQPNPALDSCHNARKHLQQSNVLLECRSMAKEYASQARSALQNLCRTDVARANSANLLAMVEYIIERSL